MTILFEPPARAKIDLFRSRLGARVRIQGWLYPPTGRATLPYGRMHEGYIMQARKRSVLIDSDWHYLPNIARAWVLDQDEEKVVSEFENRPSRRSYPKPDTMRAWTFHSIPRPPQRPTPIAALLPQPRRPHRVPIGSEKLFCCADTTGRKGANRTVQPVFRTGLQAQHQRTAQGRSVAPIPRSRRRDSGTRRGPNAIGRLPTSFSEQRMSKSTSPTTSFARWTPLPFHEIHQTHKT